MTNSERTNQTRNRPDDIRAASERHQISMCTAVITQSSAGTVTHTVAMRYMASSYQCMLYVSFIHNADILPIAASATTKELESAHDAISSTTRSANAYTPYSLITCQTSATECSKQAIRYHNVQCFFTCRYRTHYGHDGWRYHEGVHANREYDTFDVSTLAPAVTRIIAQSGCLPSIARPRAVRPSCSTSLTIRRHKSTSYTTPSVMLGISVTDTTSASMVNPMTLIGASCGGLGACSQ